MKEKGLKDGTIALFAFYLLTFPTTVIHELSHVLAAQIFNMETTMQFQIANGFLQGSVLHLASDTFFQGLVISLAGGLLTSLILIALIFTLKNRITPHLIGVFVVLAIYQLTYGVYETTAKVLPPAQQISISAVVGIISFSILLISTFYPSLLTKNKIAEAVRSVASS